MYFKYNYKQKPNDSLVLVLHNKIILRLQNKYSIYLRSTKRKSRFICKIKSLNAIQYKCFRFKVTVYCAGYMLPTCGT